MFSSPLLDIEIKLNADIGEFADWQMPMKYTSYQDEHMAVRTSCAFFDLSHMGRLRIKGKNDELDKLVAKDIKKEKEGKMIGPTAFLNERGGFEDDVMLYKVKEDEFLVVTNAINREKIISWIKKNSSLDVQDLTFDLAMIAIQGRNVWNFVEKVDLQPLEFRLNTKFMSENVFLLSRSGWTGEDGVELWGPPETLSRLITRLVNLGVKPAGLITRDSLRQEMGFVLYGEDIDSTITPIEARYWVFSLEKEFIGRDRLLEQLKTGVDKIRIGFKGKKNERVLPRKDNPFKVLGTQVGYVTSSTYSPYLNKVIGMGYVKPSHLYLGFNLNIDVRGKLIDVKISDFPLIK